MRIILRCPHCNSTQAWRPRTLQLNEFNRPILTNKSRTCVVCGKNFRIYKTKNDNNILKISY